jgi:hypothetical protein
MRARIICVLSDMLSTNTNAASRPHQIDLRDFELPFFRAGSSQAGDDNNIDGADLSPDDMLERMQDAIPRGAIELGQIQFEIRNYTRQLLSDHYYLIRSREPNYDWAIFRIRWDDNHETWQWCGDARIAGVPDRQQAARLMLFNLFESWQINLKDPDDGPYARFLREV